jgi:hypothetical protein
MEADMTLSSRINIAVAIDATLAMILGLGFSLTAPALVVGFLVPIVGVLIMLFLLATSAPGMFKGAGAVENNDPNLVSAEKADAMGRQVYLAIAIVSVLTLTLGIRAHMAGNPEQEIQRTIPALLIGCSVPLVGLILALVAGAGSLAAGKGESEALTNFTSFDPMVEQSFTVFERTSLETEKRAAQLAVLSVGSAGAIFALIVLIFGGKGEHANPVAPPPPAADTK